MAPTRRVLGLVLGDPRSHAASPFPTSRPARRRGAARGSSEASGGLTTTPSDLARFLIAFPRGLAGDTSGPVAPAIARRMMVHQPGTTPARSCIPARERRQACRTIMLGSKSGGDGLVVMANVAPEDMSGRVPQFLFMTKVVSRISDDNGWPRGPEALPDAEPESETHPLSG